MMHSLCVFCGSSSGQDPAYAAAATDLGRFLAHTDIRLIYGGGNVGLMGLLARACLDAGGEVVGVIPRHLLDREVALREVSRLIVTDDMLQRKQEMAALSDAFLALPGGLGTFDELFEMLTWTQLGLQVKPCALLNIRGYFDPLLQQLDLAIEQGFLHPGFRSLLLHGDQPSPLLAAMKAWQPPRVDKAALALEQDR